MEIRIKESSKMPVDYTFRTKITYQLLTSNFRHPLEKFADNYQYFRFCMLIIFGVTRFHFISTHTDWDHTDLAKLSVIGLSMVTGDWLILTKHYRHWICKLGLSLG